MVGEIARVADRERGADREPGRQDRERDRGDAQRDEMAGALARRRRDGGRGRAACACCVRVCSWLSLRTSAAPTARWARRWRREWRTRRWCRRRRAEGPRRCRTRDDGCRWRGDRRARRRRDRARSARTGDEQEGVDRRVGFGACGGGHQPERQADGGAVEADAGDAMQDRTRHRHVPAPDREMRRYGSVFRAGCAGHAGLFCLI